MAWLVVLLLPILAVVQAIAASVASTTQMSLQQAILSRYGRGAAAVAAISIVFISLLTLGADVQAGSEALTLLTGVPFYYFIVPLVLLVGWMLVAKSYLKIERFLAWLTLIFLCYVASAIYAQPDWGAVLRAIALPHVAATKLMLGAALALLGTTLTGYVYFWESIEVAERGTLETDVRSAQSDAAIGMLVAGSSFIFILVATAATLGKHPAAIETAAQAAAALRPLAGPWDQALFAIGLLASAAIAIPVIAATNGYVIAQTFGANAGLTSTPHQAPLFYKTIFASLGLGACLAMLPLPTIALLYWVSVAAGLTTPITLALTMLVARNPRTMRGRPIGGLLAGAGWAVTGVVAMASVGFVVSLFIG
ncbi:MAG: divalent metal cation transporter [Candidatus Eremiobacteraeota bacterium]|nr:divalent metal cation transporter [Candidatus Eremiobacteraeota bacterium]